MAAVADILDGKIISLAISTNITVPAYKNVVCSTEDIGVSGSIDGGNTVVTRCGSKITSGTAKWEITGSGAANKTVTATEMSANELAAIFQNRTTFLVRVQDETTPANYYRKGTGRISSYNETSEIEGVVGFDFTVDIDGSLTLTSA